MGEYINIHTHKKSIENAIDVFNLELFSEENSEAFFSAGLHPWDLEKVNTIEAFKYLKTQVLKDSVIAIGECGVDRVINIPVQKQIGSFIKQHEIAEAYNKPIIIHCVRAYSDFLNIYDKLKPSIPWIFHGFNGNEIIAKELLKRSCYFSFGKALLKSTKVQNVFKELPLSNIFFETDEAKINISEVYEKAAKIKHLCTDELKQIIHRNFVSVFNNLSSKKSILNSG